MKSPDQKSTREKANNAEEGVEYEPAASISTKESNERETERRQHTSKTPSAVEPRSEVSRATENDNKTEADEHNSDDELELEDEEERDPNDIVHKRAVTVTPALKQQFSRLFGRKYPECIVTEWKGRHRDMKCERCTTSGLPCTSHLGDRKLVCQECHKTSERKCSRLYEFRKEFIIGKMGIDEDLWDALVKVYLEEKSQKRIQKRMEKARRIKEAEDRRRTEEEDELNSDTEDAPQRVTMSTKEPGTRGKRKRAVGEDEGAISSSGSASPPAKKGKNKPEVVIDKRILKKIKNGERKNSKAARSNKNVKSSEYSTKANTHRVERITGDISGIIRPANTSDAVGGSKRPRRPTIRAKNAEAEYRKRRKVAENDIIGDLDTHTHDGSIGLLISTAAINTKPAPAGAKTTSPGNAAITTVVYSPPLLPASVSGSTETNVPSMSPHQKTPNAVISSPHVLPRGQAKARRLPPPRPISPELSLSVLKRALEDISSDLRYNRIDVPSAMAMFDDVAERIGRRGDLCVVLGTM